jgi:hypothetical protein
MRKYVKIKNYIYISMKIVVFDLDETLGYFTEFGIFWDCLIEYSKGKNLILSQSDFDNILDLYPEFIRPNIINVLSYLKRQKQMLCCNKMMIYTNNNGSNNWAHHILDYFSKKIDYKLFDQLISAFKINGKIVEVCRTTHDKTYHDFIKCTKVPINAEICFLDDTFYPEMANDNVYYINIKPYYYDLSFEYMLDKFSKSYIGEKIINNDESFITIMTKHINLYNYNCIAKDLKEYEMDKIVGKQIINHLHYFFNKSKKNKTKKYKLNKPKKYKLNKTRRNY